MLRRYGASMLQYPMFKDQMNERIEQGLLRTLRDRDRGPQGAHIALHGKEFINFSSNDYLGLAAHDTLTEAAAEALIKYGHGAGAARLIFGGTDLHAHLEHRIASLKQAPAALLFNSGHAANTGAIPALAGAGDHIFSDELNHASIIDGTRLSKAQVHIYKHLDMAHLESLLKDAPSRGRRMVVTDTVFSMDGDLAPLKDIYALCERYNALLYIDDAHGTGVLGQDTSAPGRGALAHFGLEHTARIIQMGTLSKALGSLGGFIASSEEVIAWLVNSARSFLYSTALPASTVAASIKAIELITSDSSLNQKLWENQRLLLKECEGFNIASTDSPIIPLITDTVAEALAISEALQREGIIAPAIRPPTVKTPRIRLTVSAGHSKEDITALGDALRKIKINGGRR
jgi:8-amino-7-oxononanoate synthase